MSFYQACYTRTGIQERESGWKVVAATEGLSKEALEHFRAISAGAIQKKNTYAAVPDEIFFVQKDERFVYLCNIVMNCVGSDGRGNSFVHGYIIAKGEHFQRCKIPSSIFGVDESEFVKNPFDLEENSMTGLPKKEDLLFRNMNYQEIIARYGIEHNFNTLMLCIFSVIERKGASLCIRVKMDQIGKLKEISRELLFCIMERLPQMLRPQLTGSSFEIGKGKVYFSVSLPEGNQEYYDLETGQWLCALSCIKKYSFVPAFIEGSLKNSIWINTEIFFENVFRQNGCARVSNSLIESVYTFYNGEEPENALNSLYAFYDAAPMLAPMFYQFLIYLLSRTNLKKTDQTILNWLHYIYDIKENQEYVNLYEKQIISAEKDSDQINKKGTRKRKHPNTPENCVQKLYNLFSSIRLIIAKHIKE